MSKDCKDCTGCTKGLDYVVDVILSDDNFKFDKLKLCLSCKTLLIETVKEAMGAK